MNAPLPAAALDASPNRAARQAQVVAALAPVLPAHARRWQREDTVPYECDGLTAYRQLPLVGFFAAGEIAHHHLYGYTGVLTVFAAD